MGVLFTSRIPQIIAAAEPLAAAAVHKAALDVEGHAKQAAPVDTGALQNSIQTAMEGALTAVVATGIEYAPYVEYGTYKMGAQPYMLPAAETVRPSFEQAMRRVFS